MKDLKNFEQNEAELREDVTIVLNQNTAETAAEKQPAVEKSGLAKALEQVIAKSQKQEQRAETDAQVVREIRSLRTADRKVYELNGGVRRTEYYPAPVHRFDETSGCYEEIGNCVSENTDAFYQAERDRFTAKFSRDETNDTLFSMERGMYRVTVKARPLAARLESPQKAAFARAKTAATDVAVLLPAGEDRLCFENYAQNTDLECKVGRKGVEERIVIHKKRPSYRYSFRLHCENVVPEQSEADGRIMLRSAETGEEVFYLPVPSLTDANGAFSDGVMLEMTETDSDTEIQVTVLADSEWIDAEERAFPVEVHPQLNASASSQIRISGYTENNGMTYKVGRAADPCCCPGGGGNTGGGNSGSGNTGGNTSSGSTGTGGCSCGGNTGGGLDIEIDPKDEPGRVILSFVPEIKTTHKVQLILYVKEKCGDCKNRRLATIQPFRILPESGKRRYYFDITEYAAQCTSYELEVIPVLPGGSGGTCCEDSCCGGGTEINGEESAYPPTLIVEKDMSFAVNLLSNAVTQELGKYGTGGVDIYHGNRLFAATDFTWEGGRMPVTIEHLYNGIFGEYEYTENAQLLLHTANFSNMKIGKGWKLNVMQSMRETNGKYVYTAANGAELEFLPYSEWKANQDKINEADPTPTPMPTPNPDPTPNPGPAPDLEPTPTPGNSDNDLCPNIYVFGSQGDIQYDAVGQVLRVGEAGSYYFDNGGRLIKTADRYGNCMLIKYTGGRITSVTDGAGRAFSFSYTSAGYLSSITAPDDTAVKYGYENGYLKSITYPDGRKTEFATANGKSIVTLKAANGSEVYVVEYEYYNKFAKWIREYGIKSGKRTLTKTTEIKNQSLKNTRQVEISEPTDQTAGDKDYIRMEYRFDNKGNIVSSHFWTAEDTRMLPQNGSYCENLLVNPGFERNINEEGGGWIGVRCGTNIVGCEDGHGYFGKRSLRIKNVSAGEESGVEQTVTLKNNSYTFSAHIQIDNDFAGSGQSGVFLRITDTQGNVIAESERISRKTPGYARLSVSFYNTAQRNVKCKIIAIGTGVAYIDGAQLEEGTGANSYNLVENGTFTKGLDCWEYASKVNGITTNIRTAGSLNVNGHSSLTYNGFRTDRLSDYPHQVISVDGAAGTRETFTLSGWAYRFSDEEGGEKSPLVLLGEINYVDETVASETMPLVYSSEVNGWQHLTGAFRKKKFEAVKNVTVYCCNTEPTDTCCFADIRLIRSGRELLLNASDFTSETSNEEQEDFKEYVDSYGNTITETVYGEESGVTLYRSYGYSANGNDMKEITDERGGKILITTDAATSRITGIKDRTGVQTNYEYDTAGRIKKMVCKGTDQKTLGQVSYEYDHFDHLTGITRGDGMKYVFGFNECGKTESITLKGHSKPLAKYTYKNGGGKLKQVVYANGEKANVTYNSLGQLVVKESRDGSGAVMERIKYDYDAQGNVVRAVDYFNRKEYTYTYSEGHIIRTVENDITVDGDERITKRTRCIAVNYEYENDGRLRKKYIDAASGKQEYSSTQSGERNVHLNLTCGGNTYRSEIYTDDLGRITSDNIVLGSGNLQRRFTYAAGSKTAEHVAHGKCRTDATTNLVKEISFTNGRTLKYEYDREERITRVTDSKAGTTQYTYDGQGRLLTETVNGAVKNTLSYDDYGNILSKNGMAYTYDTVWKDQLKTLGGEAITYDALGNPTRYKGYTLSWKNGRMKSFGEHTYAYNASGIRTEKVAKGVKHSYLLDGTRIVSERWSGQELIPMYDAGGSVYGMLYDGTAYYYLRNLQGDVLAIVDGTGKTLVEYAYDAWGKCSVVSDVSGKSLSTVNPYRYRGYYYDQETGLYYLNARYYDPEVGRFLSADDTIYLDTEVLGGQNLYAYCLNNPVMMVDKSGNLPLWAKWIIGGFTTVVGIICCCFPALQCIGVPLMIAGASMLLSNTLDAMGVDSKLASQISAGFDILAGLLLLFTPFAGIGAAMIGSGIGSYAGGYLLESLMGEYEIGAFLGGLIGGIIGGQIYKRLTTTKLFRAVCFTEANEVAQTGKFSNGKISMDGKFFATTKENVVTWGSKLGADKIISIRVNKSALSHASITFFSKLDSIGPAYYFSDLHYLNSVVQKIKILP